VSLYANTMAQVACNAVRLHARAQDLTAAELEQLDERTRRVVLPLLDGFGLSPSQIGEILDRALHTAIEKAAGRLTPDMVKDWDENVFADMRAHGLSPRKIWQKLDALNLRLFNEKPDAHAALLRAAPLGRHPRVTRMLLDWHDRRTLTDGVKSHSAKRMTAPPEAGTLTGNPGGESATALALLGKSPLGAGSPENLVA
jgi:hypothetical protein